MGGGDLNLKKSWHPHTMKNQERVWKAEEQAKMEERKLQDLRKEIHEERDREELRRLGESSGVLASSGGAPGEAKLEWMYKNSTELINREEYLLGRKIDKSFETLQAEERRQEHDNVGVKQSINHVEHECVPFSIRSYRNLQSTEQVDMQRKTMEDPLMLIKQREMESRRKLLENPVKLKEIHRILKTEQDLKAAKEKKTKKSKKSKKKKNSKKSSDESSSSESDEDLDRKLARQVSKLKGDAGNEDLKLDKLLDAKYRTISKQLDIATKRKKNKKSRCKSSDSSNENSIDERSRRRDSEHRRRRDDRNGRSRLKEKRRRNSPEEPRAHRGGSSSRSRSPRREQQTQRRRSSERGHPRPRRERDRRDRNKKHADRSRDHPGRRDQSTDRSSIRRRRSPSPAPKRPSPTKRNAGKPKLSEADREARLREMMDNATWREADRTQAVRKHREAYAREEAQNRERDFDKEFINKEVKKAISNHNSIGDRIRANLNNIQRTSSAMDTNFARK